MTADGMRIGFLTFEGCDLLDIAGPAEVFQMARVQLAEDGFSGPTVRDVLYFSPDGGPVRTAQGLTLLTEPLDRIPEAGLHTLIVVGSFHAHETTDPRLAECVRQQHGVVPRIASVCTGVFVLARAGLLDGRRATTHYADTDKLACDFPAIAVEPSCIFVEDEGVWTSAGVSAGIDMALAMVEDDFGPELAWRITKRLCLFLKRPGGEAQISMALRSQTISGPIGELLKWIAANPGADLRSEALADRANMSLRNFYRAFEDATGTSPADWVELVRLELAKRLLEQTDHHADQIAYRTGFSNYERMRRSFVRRVGASPLAYRLRQAHQAQPRGPELEVSALGSGMPHTIAAPGA